MPLHLPCNACEKGYAEIRRGGGIKIFDRSHLRGLNTRMIGSLSSGRTIAAVTTFHAAGYAQYGKRFLKTFDAHWPVDVELHVYAEDIVPAEASSRIFYYNLLDQIPELAVFKARHKNIQAHNGILEGGEYGYRMDAVRFAHKVFAMAHCALTIKEDADTLFWIDADTVTFKDIPEGFFDEVLPAGCYTSYLGRGETYPECGFVGFDLNHPAHDEFMTFWRQLYLDDSLFELPEWHDSFVYDLIRRTFEDQGKFKSHDIAANTPVSSHPFINSVLGNFMDHLKGDERKEAGASFTEDYIEAPLD